MPQQTVEPYPESPRFNGCTRCVVIASVHTKLIGIIAMKTYNLRLFHRIHLLPNKTGGSRNGRSRYVQNTNGAIALFVLYTKTISDPVIYQA